MESKPEADARDEVRGLRRALAQREHTLASVLASRSWRVTRPLRWLIAKLRGFRKLDGLAEEAAAVAAAPAGGPQIDESEATLSRITLALPGESAREEQQEIEIGQTDIRLIAFYLPQYHPFPDNDRHWGKGFTEWTNTTRAKPLFPGHYQPRLPGELGFYDLRVKEVQRRQIELARQAGISGFCYHHYWLDGRTVMDLPLRQLLEDPELDFPFCLNWANEPWTARWDGTGERGGVLIPQNHSPEDDIAFLRSIEAPLRDPRYIRVDGRPLLAVYRPGLFPDMRATIDRWREHCVSAGIGELYVALVQNVYDGLLDPRESGADAAIEFPPACLECIDVRSEVEPFDPEFPRNIYSYPEVVHCGLVRQPPEYTLLRGIMPGWDNTARRRDATLYLGGTPDLYQKWLEGLCRYTREHLPPEQRLIFINAWNEWAEGTYLEPDRKHGYAYLNRTAAALRKTSTKRAVRKVVFLGHDAARAGAQILLLHLLRWISGRTATDVRIILGGGGELLGEYQEIADVLVLGDLLDSAGAGEALEGRLRDFVGGRADLIYANTAVAGKYLPHLEFLRCPVITHIHELEQSLRVFAGDEALAAVLRLSSRLIAASPAVAANLVENHAVPEESIETVYSFVEPGSAERKPDVIGTLRQRLGVEPEDVVVFGCGTRDWRKGPDVFVEVAAQLRAEGVTGCRFLWIGPEIVGHYHDLEASLEQRGLESTVTFLGAVENPLELFAAGDLFLLSSREDPFPLVCLEAAACGLPTVCFADVGGMPDFVEDDAGVVVANGDVQAMAAAAARLVRDPGDRTARGARAREKLLQRHTTDVAAPEILQVVRSVSQTPPVVTVIIPSYNYAHYLERRLASVFDQTFQDFEIVVQDDCSTDESLELLQRYETHRNVRVYPHSRNHGAFEMWLEGLKAARGELIWIAEADDSSEPNFLETLVPLFEDERVRVAYSQSVVIDENDDVLGDYALAFPGVSETKWLEPYVRSVEAELEDGLAVQNFMVNASAVVFRKPALAALDGYPGEFRLAGDWYLYLKTLRDGCIAYCPEKLNYHRRHSGSIIASVATNVAVAEIGKIHAYVLAEYDLDAEVTARMVRYALSIWRPANQDAELEEFWRCYGVGVPAEIRGVLDASGYLFSIL